MQQQHEHAGSNGTQGLIYFQFSSLSSVAIVPIHTGLLRTPVEVDSTLEVAGLTDFDPLQENSNDMWADFTAATHNLKIDSKGRLLSAASTTQDYRHTHTHTHARECARAVLLILGEVVHGPPQSAHLLRGAGLRSVLGLILDGKSGRHSKERPLTKRGA
eukprot:1176747-Amphidinium_carterae.2